MLILETEGTNTGENGGKGEWTEETHTWAKAQRQTTKDSNVKWRKSPGGWGVCKELNAKTKKHCEQLLLCLRKNLGRYANLLYCHGTNGSFDATDIFKPNKKLQPWDDEHLDLVSFSQWGFRETGEI